MCLLISVVLVFCGVVFTEYAAIFGILGKDSTLTGRTYLWQMIWLAITDHFWLGYGYGAFWAGLDSPGSQVQAFSGWNMRSSHSGWLEIWLNLGALGATMIAYLFVRSAIAALRGLRELRPPEIYLPVTILSILFISNLIETELMRQNSVTWILFVVAVCLSHSQRSANYERSTQRVVRGARVK
jgi:O-antigen ligase